MFSLEIVNLFISLTNLSVINELSYCGRIFKKILTSDEPFQTVYHNVFFKGQLLDHTIKLPNEGMSGFTLMLKFLDLKN